ncbi:MAG: hypothetical protein MJ016_00690 [Victivallaceae bacterium]|nr:hypothetical protein [Victivallaceae bacterium]
MKKSLLLALLLAFGATATLRAGYGNIKIDSISSFKAGKWSVVGKNVFAEGGVHIPLEDFEVFADRAIINTESQDIEAVGNIRFLRWNRAEANISPSLLMKMQRRPDVVVTTQGIVSDDFDRKTIRAKAVYLTDRVSAQRMSGNLKTGYFHFDTFTITMDTMVCRAVSAERFPNGTIVVKNADFSTCEYLRDDNAHFSVYAASATLKPHASDLPGLEDVRTGMGDYSIYCANGFVKVYGVPLVWLPAFYKPRDQPLGLFGLRVGKDGDWGGFIQTYRRFQFGEYPQLSGKLMADYYSARGFGFGVMGEIAAEKSRTDFFAYAINDLHPREKTDYSKYRINVPHFRYDLRLSNITHITPRLDFRGAIEYSSDPYFTRDFFGWRYESDSAPATFAALEQQFDHFTVSIYFRPRINTFYTVVEKLPEVRLDVHRQEIFSTNLYYQGSTSAGYNQMRWIKFNEQFEEEDTRLQEYAAFRLDTTHFVYYPIRTDFFTLIPRAGLKFLVYSQSSDTPVSDNDLLKMFSAANPSGTKPYHFASFDNKGGPCVRLAAELGFQLTTKIHNTWQNIRSPFFGIDGLRHVIQPYVNYTFINVVGRGKEHVYYFDDDDRITNQNFFRFGIVNRLQTRSGGSVIDIFSMENYWDLHLKDIEGGEGQKDFSRFGNICTIVTLRPLKQLTISSQLILDFANESGDVPSTTRSATNSSQTSYNAGHPGLYCRWINRWHISITFEPIEDVRISVSYIYNRPYAARAGYSMGITQTELEAGSFFEKYYDEHNERLTGSVVMPLTPDRRTRGGFQIDYDFVKGYVSRFAFFVSRRFHCVDIIANLGFERDTDASTSGTWETSYSIQAQLVNLGGSSFGQNSALNYANAPAGAMSIFSEYQ